MSKSFFENIAPFAALAAIPVLGPGASGAVGSGILGTTPYAAPAMGAFGSADMMMTGAAGGLLGGQGAAAGLTAAEALPGTIETAGLDFINGVPQNMGARFESLLGDFADGFKPDSMLKMLNPQQEQPQRPAAIMSQVKPVGRMAPRDNEPAPAPYSQPNIGARQPTPEELQQIQMLRAMGRI